MGLMEILYSSDQNYAKQLAVSILSLISNSKEEDRFRIHVIDNGINRETRKALKAIVQPEKGEIVWEDFCEEIKALHLTTSFPKSAFGRLFLNKFSLLNKIIYIDCDMVILHSLSNLWCEDMGNCILMGVQDSVDRSYRELVGLTAFERYINSGFLVINLKAWRDNNITEKCIQYAHSWNGDIPHNDQGILNAVCRGKIKILPPAYNLQNPMLEMSVEQIRRLGKIDVYYTQEEIDEAVKDPVVVHFTEEFYNRPWFAPCTHPYRDCYWRYATQIAWHGEAKPHALSRNAKIMAYSKKWFSFWGYLFLMRVIGYKRSKRYETKKHDE